MKIATYNINGIKARLPRLLEWLEETRPAVACLQEIKSQDEGFPAAEIEALGYAVITHGQKAFNGVAILVDTAAGHTCTEVRRGLGIPGPNEGDDEQARYLEALAACELTFGVGPAGTGKTFLAAAWGASLLRRGEVDRLVITRPAVEAGERLGFLPGDLNEKVDPYLAPIWEALNDILGPDDVRRRRDRGEIEAAPIAFMRGRTLSHAFIIADEAQNLTRLQMKMVLTRLGEGARMVVTGDPSQVDLLNARDSGLAHALTLLRDVKGVGIMTFEARDVVRHALVERIVRAYDSDAAEARGGAQP